MNIFQKIKFVNKLSKKIKEVKKYLDSTHIDDELKEILTELKSDIQKLTDKIPETKELVYNIADLMKWVKNK